MYTRSVALASTRLRSDAQSRLVAQVEGFELIVGQIRKLIDRCMHACSKPNGSAQRVDYYIGVCRDLTRLVLPRVTPVSDWFCAFQLAMKSRLSENTPSRWLTSSAVCSLTFLAGWMISSCFKQVSIIDWLGCGNLVLVAKLSREEVEQTSLIHEGNCVGHSQEKAGSEDES